GSPEPCSLSRAVTNGVAGCRVIWGPPRRTRSNRRVVHRSGQHAGAQVISCALSYMRANLVLDRKGWGATGEEGRRGGERAGDLVGGVGPSRGAARAQ